MGQEDCAGAGGGKIKLEAFSSLTVDGNISANGGNGHDHVPATGDPCSSSGGGSGGSIYIDTNLLGGAGTISANGGNVGIPGGGGRIAVYYSTSSFATTSVKVKAGTGGNNSAKSGTIYWEEK